LTPAVAPLLDIFIGVNKNSLDYGKQMMEKDVVRQEKAFDN
jgi:hypothetical protein